MVWVESIHNGHVQFYKIFEVYADIVALCVTVLLYFAEYLKHCHDEDVTTMEHVRDGDSEVDDMKSGFMLHTRFLTDDDIALYQLSVALIWAPSEYRILQKDIWMPSSRRNLTVLLSHYMHAFICICVFNCCLYIVVYIDLLLSFTR